MKRGSSLRLMEWPMPPTSALGRGVVVMSCVLPPPRGVVVLSGLLPLPGRVLNGLDDVDVPRAPAEVAGDGVADLVFLGVLRLLQGGVAGQHHARRAEPAVQAGGL